MGTLEEFINSFGCPIEDAITYLSQIGKAVLFLHNRRFIHRNLRAASIFIDSNGNVSQIFNACTVVFIKLACEHFVDT
jgi:serine/threonine protein kinase